MRRSSGRTHGLQRAWRIAEGRAAFRLRVGIQGLDEQCFSSKAFKMMNPRWISRLLIEKHSLAAARCIVRGMAAAILVLTAVTAVAQLPIFVSHQAAPEGYTLHESIDLADMWPMSTAAVPCTTLWSTCSPAR